MTREQYLSQRQQLMAQAKGFLDAGNLDQFNATKKQVEYSLWEKVCGKGRIIPAFPGAGGSIREEIMDAGLPPRLIPPTTFAEIYGVRTERIDTLKKY